MHCMLRIIVLIISEILSRNWKWQKFKKAVCFGKGHACNLSIKMVSQEHLEFYDSLSYIGDLYLKAEHSDIAQLWRIGMDTIVFIQSSKDESSVRGWTKTAHFF